MNNRNCHFLHTRITTLLRRCNTDDVYMQILAGVEKRLVGEKGRNYSYKMQNNAFAWCFYFETNASVSTSRNTHLPHFYSYDSMHYGAVLSKWFLCRLLTRTLMHWTRAGIRVANAARARARQCLHEIRAGISVQFASATFIYRDQERPKLLDTPNRGVNGERGGQNRLNHEQSCNAEYKSGLSLRPGGYWLV